MTRNVYWSRASVSVCVRVCTDPDVSWVGEWQGCPLVLHYLADLQSVQGFRCYDNSAEREISASTCSMPSCVFVSTMDVGCKTAKNKLLVTRPIQV